MQPAFRLSNVVKSFQDFQLGPLRFELEPGRVLGYVGPNGSGKTTTMHCLAGLLKPDSGSVEIFGQGNDPDEIGWKYDVGYVGDAHAFYEGWSGDENLKILARFYPDWSNALARELATRFGIDLQQKVSTMSSGNRVKLALIAAMAHRPKLLLLDEPTAGLDPIVRAEVLDVLYEILEDGEHAIFYSTHILSDISRLADELAFLENGRVKLRAETAELMERWARISFRLAGNGFQLRSAFSHRREGSDHQVISSDSAATLEELTRVGAENIRLNRMSIDEIAVQILKGEPDDVGATEN